MRSVMFAIALFFCCCTNIERGCQEYGVTRVSARAIVLEFTPWLELQPWWFGGPVIDLQHVELKIYDSLVVNEVFVIESTGVSDDTLYFPFWVRAYQVNGIIVDRLKLDSALNVHKLSSKYLEHVRDRVEISTNKH